MAGTGDREAVKTYKPGSGEAASRQPVSSKVPDCSHTTCAYSSCFNQLCLSLCTQGSHVRHVHMTHAHSTHETYSICLLHAKQVYSSTPRVPPSHCGVPPFLPQGLHFPSHGVFLSYHKVTPLHWGLLLPQYGWVSSLHPRHRSCQSHRLYSPGLISPLWLCHHPTFSGKETEAQ